ncbi:MAG: ABC transporter ATP-binding protein [Isosphaeraceae bacterium]
MSDVAIRAEELGKRYRIEAVKPRYQTLREVLTRKVMAPLRRARAIGRSDRPGPAEEETVWALRDASFEVRAGEVVGVIGRNGAGKSTLLKILTRITPPTVGHAELFGRVGSLLEVGTGFHPELSGRENTYLSGAILGMSRLEIGRRFDEIVEFSGVSKFIDTPVKHYSSGMYLRLAFAVAAHLQTEILLVDEVLAVGDASFQRKCLNKMEDVGQQGRAVLFISHSMPAVTRLCSRTILLDEGRVVQDGPSHEVVGTYLVGNLGTTAAREWPDLGEAPGNEIVRLRAVRVRSEDGRVVASIDIRNPVGIEMEYEVRIPGHVLVPNLHFHNEEGVCVFVTQELEPEWRGRPRPAGRYVSTAWVPGNFLSEGTLVVGAAISTMTSLRVHFFERDAVAFQVVDSTDGDSARGDYAGRVPGVVRPLLRWTTAIGGEATSSSMKGLVE